MTYKFEHINGGLEITPDSVDWTYAGFSKKGNIHLDVELKTEKSIYSVRLETTGEAKDRSDEAITALMNQLLEPYKV